MTSNAESADHNALPHRREVLAYAGAALLAGTTGAAAASAAPTEIQRLAGEVAALFEESERFDAAGAWRLERLQALQESFGGTRNMGPQEHAAVDRLREEIGYTDFVARGEELIDEYLAVEEAMMQLRPTCFADLKIQFDAFHRHYVHGGGILDNYLEELAKSFAALASAEA